MLSPSTLNSWIAAPWARKVKADSGDWEDILGIVWLKRGSGYRGLMEGYFSYLCSGLFHTV